MPVDAEFRVGTMGLGWDSEAQSGGRDKRGSPTREFDVALTTPRKGPTRCAVFDAGVRQTVRYYHVISADARRARSAMNR